MSTLAHTPPATRLLWKGWWAWLVLALFYAYEFIHRIAPAVMVPELMHALGVGAAAVGSLSAYYYYAYAFTQIPAGYLYDRFNTRYVISGATFSVALGSLWMAQGHSLGALQAARALIGFGSAFAFVGCIKLGMSWLPYRSMPILIGLTNLFGVLGAILGGGPLAHALEYLDWRTLYLWGSLVGMLLLLMMFLWVREGPRLVHDAQHPAHPLSHILKHVVGHRQTWLCALYGTLIVVPISVFAELWGTPFLMSAYPITRPEAATYISYIFCGIAVGGPLLGWMSRFVPVLPLMALGALGAATTLMLVLSHTTWSSTELTLLLLIYGLCSSHMLLIFSFVSMHHPAWANGTAVGFSNTLIMAAGAIFQPLMGRLIDQSNSLIPLHEMKILSVGLPCVLLLAALLLLFLRAPSSWHTTHRDDPTRSAS